tara:strand:- start:292 stop:507 length:216 start_codon:yes stop_codon:yes gene_type:complete
MKNFLLGVFASVAIVALCGANAQRVAPKYKVETAVHIEKFEDALNELTAQGWELVEYEPRNNWITAVFKKE